MATEQNVMGKGENGMPPVIKGKVFKVGDNVNTDYIIPAKYLDLYEPEELGPHAFEGLGAEYSQILYGHMVVVGGDNFGLGSAREQAPNALKGAGIKAIVAKSFARIFYRNALNVGIPAIECPEAAEVINQGEMVEIDLENGVIMAGCRAFHFPHFPKQVMELLEAGGMVPFLKKVLAKG
jgi:3-isopropylmalate/(R)-2-methylmalate dehydratase small subunit